MLKYLCFKKVLIKKRKKFHVLQSQLTFTGNKSTLQKITEVVLTVFLTLKKKKFRESLNYLFSSWVSFYEKTNMLQGLLNLSESNHLETFRSLHWASVTSQMTHSQPPQQPVPAPGCLCAPRAAARQGPETEGAGRTGPACHLPGAGLRAGHQRITAPTSPVSRPQDPRTEGPHHAEEWSPLAPWGQIQTLWPPH